jgi:hypothetical protein
MRKTEAPIPCAAADCTNFATIMHEEIPYCGKHALDSLERGVRTIRPKSGLVDDR